MRFSWLMLWSTEKNRCSSIFRPEPPLRSDIVLEKGGSEGQANVIWPDGGVFLRSRRTYPANLFSLGLNPSQVYSGSIRRRQTLAMITRTIGLMADRSARLMAIRSLFGLSMPGGTRWESFCDLNFSKLRCP